MPKPPVVGSMFSPGEGVMATSLRPVGKGVTKSSVVESMLVLEGDVFVTSSAQLRRA